MKYALASLALAACTAPNDDALDVDAPWCDYTPPACLDGCGVAIEYGRRPDNGERQALTTEVTTADHVETVQGWTPEGGVMHLERSGVEEFGCWPEGRMAWRYTVEGDAWECWTRDGDEVACIGVSPGWEDLRTADRAPYLPAEWVTLSPAPSK